MVMSVLQVWELLETETELELLETETTEFADTDPAEPRSPINAMSSAMAIVLF